MTTAQPQPYSMVDGIYEDFQRMMEQIDVSEVSLRNSVEDIFQKSLAVAIGTYFERRVTDIVLEFVKKSSGNNDLVAEFVWNKAIYRKYHSYFDWSSKTANTFFVLFGKDFRDYMKEYIKDTPKYGENMEAFMEVGDIRNKVAHTENPTINQTTQELYALYEKAFVFVDELPLRFGEFERRRASE